MTATPDKVAVITGASAGIGLAAAKALASQGWWVIGVGRDAERLAAARQSLTAVATARAPELLQADLSSLAQTRQLAERINALTPRIDLLANNAGGMARECVVTAEGLEANFASNHLGPFLLTNTLLPALQHTASTLPPGSVRIVNTSSRGSEMCTGFQWDDLQRLHDWDASESYLRCKLANVLHARALADRLAPQGILAMSFHPGDVASNFISHVPDSVRQYIAQTELVPVDEGADTLVWLATAPADALHSGRYYHQRALRTAHPWIDDPQAVERLWAQSEQLTRSLG